MTNQEQVNSILAMDDDLAKVESITDGMPVDDYSPEDNKELTLDDIFGVTANDQPQTFGDSFAPLGDDTKTEEGREMITQAFVSELNKLPDQKIEIADIPAIAATVQMRTGAKGAVSSDIYFCFGRPDSQSRRNAPHVPSASPISTLSA